MLLRNDSPRDALLKSILVCVLGAGGSYRSQHRGHEFVSLLGLHEATDLEHADGQAGYHGRVLGQGLLQHLAILFIVLQRPDFRHATEALKGSQVRLVDMGKMGICYYDVGQGLDVAEAVRQSTFLQQSRSLDAVRKGAYLVGSSRRQ
jgi:hypothetical protein